jgi:hypothetical protein
MSKSNPIPTLLLTALLTLLPRLAIADEAIKLFPGWPMVVATGESAHLDDPSIAQVNITKSGVEVVGLKEGHSRLTVTSAGKSSTLEVEVVAAGFRLIKVAVLKTDVPDHTAITQDMIEGRMVPSFMVNGSMVKFDDLHYALDHLVWVQVQRGDMLLWANLESNELHDKRVREHKK